MSEVDPNLRLLEAVLFASAEPLSERALANRLPEEADLKALLTTLRADYAGRGVTLVRRGKSWAFRTAEDLSGIFEKEMDVARKLSRAAVETLAIVAYHQPVTRGEIEEIRGVSLSKGTLDTLFEAGWVKPGKRRETPGRPLTWSTTDDFLDHFGLETLRDLPGVKELKAAGLLESGPAISAYRSTGEMVPASGDSGDLLPTEALMEEPAEELEPLDPEGD